MTQIFMSYRRDDSQGYANGLYDRLSGHFGAESVIRDLDSIPVGADFERFIEESVNSCHVLVALIGPDWLAATDAAGGRRLDRPHDYVRLEIGKALARATPVIPVLLNEAQMPSDAELPPDLAPLATRNALEISDSRWTYDVGRLIAALEKYLAEPQNTAGDVTPVQRVKNVSPRWALAAAGIGVVVLSLLAFTFWPSDPPSNGPRTPEATRIESPDTVTTTAAQPAGTVTRESVGSWSGRSNGLTLIVTAIREVDREEIHVDMAVQNSTGDAIKLDTHDFSMVDDTGKNYETDPFDFFSDSWPKQFPPGSTSGQIQLNGPLQAQARRINQLGFGVVYGTTKVRNIYVQGIPLPPAKA
jgi:hypothetical protein